MALSMGMKIARILAIAAVIGSIIGMVARLSIVGDRPTEQIMSSGLGWTAIACIIVGAWGLGSGFYNYKTKGVAIKLLLSTLLLSGGLMWVLPLPH
jgi:hypothetical protein